MRRSLPPGRPLRLPALALVVVLLVAGGFVWFGGEDTPTFETHEDVVEAPAAPGSQERVRLDTTLYVPDVTPAPAVLVPHGFGGDKTGVSDTAAELAERGFVVLTWSARGFGESTGRISLNDPDREVADATRLVDHLATRPEVRLDTEGDPRIGVTGASYGGALALLLAGTDDRIDAIAPTITYNDLAQALLPNGAADVRADAGTPAESRSSPGGVLKRAWAGTLFSAGHGTGTGGAPAREAIEPGDDPDDFDNPSDLGAEVGRPATPEGPAAGTAGRPGTSPDPHCGRFTDEVCAAYTDVATDGRMSERTRALLRRISPVSVTESVTVPTLLVQGENDTLFGLDQADANARQIAAAGGDVSVVWYTGGHDGGSPGARLRDTIGDFLEHHLAGAGPEPADGFRYDVQGALRADGAPSVRTVRAPRYPGLPSGTTGDGSPEGRETEDRRTERREVVLDGREQLVRRPPGATPAAVSGIPGLNRALSSSSRLSGLFTVDPPGQSASFTSAALEDRLLVAGSSTVTLRVAAAGGTGDTDAALFAKLYDVHPDGGRTLPGNAVMPVRLPSLPADGSPVEVDVTLPGIVRPVEEGHRVQLVVGTTDQAYATPTDPAAFRVSLAGDGVLSAPVVDGTTDTTEWPVAPLLGAVGVLGAAAVVLTVAALRRRRSDRVDPDLAGTPLVIDGLTKSYPGGFTAVRDLSFRVEPGQVLGLLGPNGAGKTTTLRMLMGLITPTDGAITVFGHRVRPGAPVLSRIGSFVEGSGFLPHLSGADNLRLHWDATGRPREQAHVAEALEIAGLGDAVHRRVRTYSQGMRQRLAIAQAMLGLPELLVLDEPTNGLDPPQIHQMRAVLRRYAATGRTVLVSSHLLAEVEQTCTHVVVMHRGGLVAEGAVSEIVSAGGAATFRVDDADAAVDALRSVGGVSAVRADGPLVHADLDGLPRSEAVAALVRAGVSVEQAGPRRRLEDAFLRLVGEGEPG